MKTRIALLTVALFFAPSIPPKGIAEIDAVLQNAVQSGTVPGVVAVVADKNQILYHHAYGLRDVANKSPMQEDTIFRIASMTKPITSSAIMQLVEQGKLKLDDPVSKYLPNFANREVVASFDPAAGTLTTRKPAGELQIHHLLSHTSGLAYGFSNTLIAPLQQKTGKQVAEDLPLLYDPGTKWTYSSSTKVLGQVVEKVTGMPLDQYLYQHFIQPLGMADTSYVVPAAKTGRVVTVQNRATGKLVETANPAAISSPVAGDGGLNATAVDYIRFLQMFLNDGKAQSQTILSKASIAAMTSNQIGSVVVDTQPAAQAITRPFPVAPAAGRDKFGFGFEITASNKENPNLRSAGSYTWAGIYNTHFWVDPKRGIAAVIMFQVLPFYDDATMKVYQDFEAAVGRNLR